LCQIGNADSCRLTIDQYPLVLACVTQPVRNIHKLNLAKIFRNDHFVHSTEGALFSTLYSAFFDTMRVNIVASARKHGILDSDIYHAVRNASRTIDLDGYTIIIGPDIHANLLELAVNFDNSQINVFHAMPARPKFLEGR
jgi:hypothetical protein